jgi:anti-sigma factor (TIGR02949 family)
VTNKKSCRETIDLLMDYLEGRLSPQDHEALKNHFADCPPCLAFVRSYQETPRILRKATEIHLPPEMESRLQKYLRAKHETK